MNEKHRMGDVDGKTLYIPTVPVGLKSSRDRNDKHGMGDVDGKTLYNVHTYSSSRVKI